MEGKIIVSEDPTPCVKYLNLGTLIIETGECGHYLELRVTLHNRAFK